MDGEQAGRQLLRAAWEMIDWAASSVAHAVRDGVGEPISTPVGLPQRHSELHPRVREFRAILASRGVAFDDELTRGLEDLIRHAAAKACHGVFTLLDGVADVGDDIILRVETDDDLEIPTYLGELFFEYDTDERNHFGR